MSYQTLNKYSYGKLKLKTLIPFSFLNFALGNVNKTSSSDIELSGKLDECSLRSDGKEIIASKEPTSIILSPMISMNNITILIKDLSGRIVFFSNENLKVDENILIDTSVLVNGSYILSIKSMNGGSLSGVFDVR